MTSLRFLPLALALAGLGCHRPPEPPPPTTPFPSSSEASAPARLPTDASGTSTMPTPPTPHPPAPPAPASTELEQSIRAAIPPPIDRPVTLEPPEPVEDAWITPGGAPITHTFVVEWSRPPEQDGWPTTAYYAASERRFWLLEGHLRGGISTHQTWFGPFEL